MLEQDESHCLVVLLYMGVQSPANVEIADWGQKPSN